MVLKAASGLSQFHRQCGSLNYSDTKINVDIAMLDL
jgi:hypothetical protein